MAHVFADFDFGEFWAPPPFADRSYVDIPITDEIIAGVEGELGYKLPASYVDLMWHQNGGIPRKNRHRMTSAYPIVIRGIFPIGRSRPHSLCGRYGSRFWIDEWEYPPIGVYFADCPSGCHDLMCLDYRDCGPTGEPRVVHVDQEREFEIVVVAETFEAFIRGLESRSAIADE